MKMQLAKNGKAYQQLSEMAKEKNIDFKVFLMDDNNADQIVDAIYGELPKSIRMFAGKNKVKEVFIKRKDLIIGSWIK